MKTKPELKRAEKKLHQAIKLIEDLKSIGVDEYSLERAKQYLNDPLRDVMRDLAKR